jgi:SAM-dependent methyltransferase
MKRLVLLLTTWTTSIHALVGVTPPQKCAMRRQLSLYMESSSAVQFETEEEHLTNQADAFDMMAPMFSRSDGLPPDTAAVVNHIAVLFLDQVVENAKAAALKAGKEPPTAFRVLDIGCGAGVLFRFLMDHANKLGISLHITGVDVSARMAMFGKGHACNVLGSAGEQHSIDVIADDFVKYLQDKDELYNGVIANSCFANFWDIQGSIEAMTKGVTTGGMVVVAHPVGAEFVRGLHNLNPKVTPHLMPTKSEFEQLTLGLKMLDYQEELEWDGRALPLYYASAVKN